MYVAQVEEIKRQLGGLQGKRCLYSCTPPSTAMLQI